MFNDLLDETKGFKYQTILKVKFKKYIGSKIEVSPVFFNTTIKTMINHEFKLDRSFQEILYRFDNWLMKVLVGLLNQSSLNTLIFQFLDHYSKVQFKNYFKQIPAPFKIHADFECILKSLESNEDSCSKKYQDQIPCSNSWRAWIM